MFCWYTACICDHFFCTWNYLFCWGTKSYHCCDHWTLCSYNINCLTKLITKSCLVPNGLKTLWLRALNLSTYNAIFFSVLIWFWLQISVQKVFKPYKLMWGLKLILNITIATEIGTWKGYIFKNNTKVWTRYSYCFS